MTEEKVEPAAWASAEQTLERWFGTPFLELSSHIQEVAALAVHPDEWHALSPEARRLAAQTFDVAAAAGDWAKLKASLPPRGRQPTNPVDEAVEGMAWYDATLHARHWFSLPVVDPEPAAMLLCNYNPTTDSPAMARSNTTDATERIHFALLVQRFEAEARVHPQHRTLLDWLRLARASKLRYHPWVDEYVEAAGLEAPSPTPTEPGPEADDTPPPAVAAPIAAPDWKGHARAEARRVRSEREALGQFPALGDLGDEVARLFRAQGITGPNGHALSGAYIKRWALQGQGGITADAKRLKATLNTRGK